MALEPVALEPIALEPTAHQPVVHPPGFFGRHGATLACGIAALLLVGIIGGFGAWLIIDRFNRSVELGARTEVSAIGTAVAGALAHQFERAGDYGIPLDKLGGVSEYLTQTARDVRGVARIVLRLSNGQEIRPANDEDGNGDPTRETVFAPIFAGGGNLGQIEVLTDAAELITPLARMRALAALMVGGLALIAALAAATLVGRRLDQRRIEFLAHLDRNAGGNFIRGAVPRVGGHDDVAHAYQALRTGEERMVESRAAVDAYAEELLGVDFDGVLRDRIERTVRELG
ncbi:hypothetical protein G3545_10320 [Starkeya sp. ORNL1]|uniref:hypothetical protein n=1 Tax=Starkeya sp. ORNL1 TaxID=2709380 RepID=UPI001462CBA9|nr:hypothetical protein [Starkeya sp. ORNL1]QJP14006.1 hypothetical protein G3545_10320 [Starkeya sp. ORNL1]